MVTSCLLAMPSLAAACAPYVEERNGSVSASFRRHSNDLVSCQVTESSYDEVIRNWLRNRPSSAPPLSGLSLGRAVDFPWISRHLADKALKHPRWDVRRGKVRVGGLNQFVAAVLSEEEFLARLAEPFAGTPYMPVSVSVEKVLVGKATNVAPDLRSKELLVPFDAQLWLHLRANR